MMKPTLPTLVLLACLLPGAAAAGVQTYASAATAAEFLSIPAGARPSALGEAFTGVAGDLNALYWNPAGLNGITAPRLMLSHNSWIESINLEYLTYAQAVPNLGVVGAGLSYVNFGAIDRWTMDSSGNPVPSSDTYTPFALAGKLAFALPVGKGFSAGAGLSISYEQIDNSGSLAGSLDLGTVYQASRDFSAGVSLKHIGINGDESLLPMALNLGAAYHLPYSFSASDLFTLLGDVELKYDENPVLGVGVEYTNANLFQVRLGWNQNLGRTDPNRLGLTAGAGIFFGNWNLDYAFAPQGDLGNSHRVSLQYAWEGGAPHPWLIREAPAAKVTTPSEPAPAAKENTIPAAVPDGDGQ